MVELAFLLIVFKSLPITGYYMGKDSPLPLQSCLFDQKEPGICLKNISNRRMMDIIVLA